MKLLFYSNIPSPYFVEFLNELGKLAEVIAVFEKASFSHRDASWKSFNSDNFIFYYLHGFNITKTLILDFNSTKYIKENPDALVIIANPLSPVGMQCIEYCRHHNRYYVIQSEGGIPKNGRGLKEKIKHFFLHDAPLYLSGMRAESDYFTFYGANPERIRTYPFASLHEKDLISKVFTKEQKQKLKRELQIKQEYVLLYVGRMIPSKGIDLLIRACQRLPDNIGVYLAGGKPVESYLNLAKNLNVNSFHYIPHVSLDVLKKYYLASDLFILPTRSDTWGLVINEAMSYGLPIVTTKNCVAGTQLVQNGKNGFLIESEDFGDLRVKIDLLISDDNLRNEMGRNNIAKMKNYTYENMAKVIFNYLNEVL